MIMGMIGRGVKACHLMAIMFVVSFCLFSIPITTIRNLNLCMVAAQHAEGGALTIVDVQDDDEGDGLVTVESNSNDGEIVEEMANELFEPTNDWKTIRKGQNIPAGLHVRLNMQTGEREAKLMDKPKLKVKDATTWYAGEKIGTIKAGRQQYSRDVLKKALEDFKFDDPDPNPKPETSDSIPPPPKEKFRSYEELKDMMKQMKMSIKTEAEIVTLLLGDLKESTNIEDMKTHLIDLEYYLHQVDNARLFCDLEGMQVMGKLMNHSEEDIRMKAVWTLGSALQSNAKVQVKAVESGMLQQLLRLMAIDTSAQVKKKTLFALSTLLRQFPFAQHKFVEAGGMSAITDLFIKCGDESLKVKIVTLLTDLVQENDHHSSTLKEEEDEVQQERSRQYAQVNIRHVLQQSGWCSHLSTLLDSKSNHDNVEKILEAMTVLYDTCHGQFASLRSTFQALSKDYDQLAKLDKEQGETDTFYAGIHAMLSHLIQKVQLSREDL